jgi:hypothetical protein
MNRIPLAILLVVLAKASDHPMSRRRWNATSPRRRSDVQLQDAEDVEDEVDPDSIPEPEPEHARGLHPLLLVAMTGILTVPIAISASKHYYSRKAIEALPRAIALSPDQLGAHIMGEKPTAELGNLKARQLAEEWSAWTETEFVYTGEQKGSVFIFAAPDSTRYVVITIKRCPDGPPLLPALTSEGSLDWTTPDPAAEHFANYLRLFIVRVKGEEWGHRIQDHLNNQPLVSYQAAVTEEDWRAVWDALLKPFTEQRTAYRRHYRTKKAPEIFFGVQAKLHDPGLSESGGRACGSIDEADTEAPGSRDDSISGPSAANSGRSIDEVDGIVLPSAADWLEFWGQEGRQIPRQRTFVNFASNLSDSAFPRRSFSDPDLSRTLFVRI